jgi:deoxyribonuclease-1
MAQSFRNIVATGLALLVAACGTTTERTFLPREGAPPLVLNESQAWDRLAELPWPQGGQRTYRTYDEARRVFWKKLYPQGGTELYCGVSFDGARHGPVSEPLSVEHVYPADTIAETEPSCSNRNCSATRVQRAMADMQNLWPAFQRVNSSRSNLRFGDLPEGTPPRFADFCPTFRRSAGSQAVVEPRDEVKGDVARSLVYMHFVYGLPLENVVSDKRLLLGWMQADPPDNEEMRRNATIDALQGTPNPLLMEAFLSFNGVAPWVSAEVNAPSADIPMN